MESRKYWVWVKPSPEGFTIAILPFGFRKKSGATTRLTFVSDRRFRSAERAMAQANSLFGPVRWKSIKDGWKASVELFYERHWN